MVLSLRGRIDASSSGDMEKRINTLIDSGNRVLLVNFSEVDYINSSGLRIMLSSLKRLKKMQGDMKLSCMKPMVRQVFDMAGFLQIFELYETEEKALNRTDGIR